MAVPFVVTAGGGCGECDDEGARWCEDNTLHYCKRPYRGEFVNRVIRTDCDEWDATCREVDHRTAACAISDEPCPAGKWSVCVGSFKANCLTIGYPAASTGNYDGDDRDCADEGMICLDPPTYYQAMCAFIEGFCEDFDTRCHPDDPNLLLECYHEVWAQSAECDDGTVCVETSETTAECAPE